MKNTTLLESNIYALARRIVKKRKPTIVGVTGSVGGASTMAAILAVLEHAGLRVRVAPRSPQDALNLSAALIGGYGSSGVVIHTGALYLRGLRRLILPEKHFPDVLLVEYAADTSGEMEEALSIAIPTVGVFTSRAPVHIRNFGTMEKAFEERARFARAIQQETTLALFGDDPSILALAQKTRAKVTTYGLSDACALRAVDIRVTEQMDGDEIHIDGMSMKLVSNGNTIPTMLRGVLGGGHVHAALAAAAVGTALGINLLEVSEGLRAYQALPGRSRILNGIKKTLLIDDTYNASSASCIAALQSIGELTVREGGERFAVLGEMMYLGDYTDEQYDEIGKAITACGISYLMTVGHAAEDIGKIARSLGMDEARIYHFEHTDDAGRFLQERIEVGDIVYIAGSQEAGMEHIVREVMADPLHAKQLLVRQ